MRSGMLGVLPGLRGVVPGRANDFRPPAPADPSRLRPPPIRLDLHKRSACMRRLAARRTGKAPQRQHLRPFPGPPDRGSSASGSLRPGPRLGTPAATMAIGIQDQPPPELDEEYAA